MNADTLARRKRHLNQLVFCCAHGLLLKGDEEQPVLDSATQWSVENANHDPEGAGYVESAWLNMLDEVYGEAA